MLKALCARRRAKSISQTLSVCVAARGIPIRHANRLVARDFLSRSTLAGVNTAGDLPGANDRSPSVATYRALAPSETKSASQLLDLTRAARRTWGSDVAP